MITITMGDPYGTATAEPGPSGRGRRAQAVEKAVPKKKKATLNKQKAASKKQKAAPEKR